MANTHKVSYVTLLVLIFLLPVFSLPASVLPLGAAKAGLLALGALVAVISYGLYAQGSGEVVFPKTRLLSLVIALPAVYAVSALVSGSRSLSLFGYNLEPGTAVYITFASALMGLSALVFVEPSRLLRAFVTVFISLTLLSLITAGKILFNFDWPLDTIGGWMDQAVAFGLLASLSALALGALTLKKSMKIFVSAVFALSTALLAVMNFSTSFIFTLAAAVVVLVYLNVFGQKNKMAPALILALVSLVFMINPVISDTRGTLGDTVSEAFGINNLDVRPAFLTTVGISGLVLSDSPLLGAGPNTWSQSWLQHKPADLNRSVFWNASFPSGFGFVPTQLASVGLLGALAWIAFFTFFLKLGYKALTRLPKDEWGRFFLASTFLSSAFLWLASFMYAPSSALLALAFILTGLFVAACAGTGVIELASPKSDVSRNTPGFAFVMNLVLIVLALGSVTLGFSVFERTAAAYHYQRALVLANTEGTQAEEVEQSLVRAIRLAPNDRYWGSLSEISIVRAQAALNATDGSQEENATLFRNSLSRGISAAQAAVNENRAGYRNWTALGSIYSSLVPKPFEVEGAYESAKAAFEEARKRNPNTPEVSLLLAGLELNKGDSAAARALIEDSLKFKNDYADAYFLLTQLEIRENNIPGAIRSAETSALLSPENAGVFFQLGLLKYSNGDWRGAQGAFNQALKILPEYANAKYFLGLSLARLGEREEAIAKFEEFSAANPDNSEITQILANLRKGKDALAGIPREDANISTRQSPPISERE